VEPEISSWGEAKRNVLEVVGGVCKTPFFG
jgi:hypothetical protein